MGSTGDPNPCDNGEDALSQIENFIRPHVMRLLTGLSAFTVFPGSGSISIGKDSLVTSTCSTRSAGRRRARVGRRGEEAAVPYCQMVQQQALSPSVRREQRCDDVTDVAADRTSEPATLAPPSASFFLMDRVVFSLLAFAILSLGTCDPTVSGTDVNRSSPPDRICVHCKRCAVLFLHDYGRTGHQSRRFDRQF